MNPVPKWALIEMVEDLEDAACDYGEAQTEIRAGHLNDAAEKLRRAIEVMYADG